VVVLHCTRCVQENIEWHDKRRDSASEVQPCIHVIIYLENILSINGKYADIMEHIFDVPAAHYLYQIKQLKGHAVKIFLITKLR
jgi:hypothetical protein